MSRSFVRVRPGRGAAAALACALLACTAITPSAHAAVPTRAPAHSFTSTATSDVLGTVSDSASGGPIASAEVSVSRDGAIVANTATDEFGRFTIHNLDAGNYTIAVHFIGFRPQSNALVVPASGGDLHVAFKLVAAAISLQAVQVQGSAPVAVDTRTGDQTFQQNDYHGSPSNTTSQLLQQSIAGAARAPTGEVHIRGQHAEYTYYVDGVPVPPGISGSLNELFDPEVVNRIDFQTGGWDAEYGGRNAAVINVQTKIPSGGFHLNASGYSGSFASQGGALSVSGNSGSFGAFLSGAYQTTNMRQDPVMGDSVTNAPLNYHNSGTDAFGFGKLEYRAGASDVVDLDLNWSRTHFQVPYDTSGGTNLDDHQTDMNGFANLGWHHLFSPADSSNGEAEPTELFTGLYYRSGSLHYEPGATDQPSFVFFPDTTTLYNLSENRSFDVAGLKMDLTLHPGHDLMFKGGITASSTSGHEDFHTFDANGNTGPVSNSGLTGTDAGAYVETAYSPVEQLQIRAGARYDAHKAPFASTQTQLSPRIRFNFYPDASTTLYVYYGRQFMPTNTEDLRAITNASQGAATSPTLPERDDFWEAGAVRRYPFGGLVTKLSAYYKHSKPGIDDNTVPGSAITTDVNLAQVWITGLEGVIQFQPAGPISGYVNMAINHAYGEGPVTGGFFPTDNPEGYFDLDHDQRVSIVGSATYSANRFYASATEIYGSGLTNGVDPSDCGCAYGTGLFSFNSGIKVKPNAITNVSLGYTIVSGNTVLRPELFINNLWDSQYILKGAFFSGASWGRPRTLELRMNVGM